MEARLIFVFLILQFGNTLEKNVLFLNGIVSLSHHMWTRVLMEELARSDKGYNLTILSTEVDEAWPNMHYLHLEKTKEAVFGGDDAFDLTDFLAEEKPATKGIWDIYNYYFLSCRGSYKSDGFKTLLNYPDDFNFDLILTDFGIGPCLLSFLHKFRYPPIIGFSPFNSPSNKIYLVGGHSYPAYVPFWSLVQEGPMNFFQRLYNAYVYAYQQL
jgi:glucuronosyltransferase